MLARVCEAVTMLLLSERSQFAQVALQGLPGGMRWQDLKDLLRSILDGTGVDLVSRCLL